MRRAIAAALVVAGGIVLEGAGCRREVKQEELHSVRSSPRTPAPPREPSRAGDYIIYPLQWRSPDETAYRLYALLYPKYGPYLQIIPDRDTDSLWIYLPPRGSRPQGSAPSVPRNG
jgi:hypothetical protein